MFLKAARQSARLKGERYEGAIIIEATWRKVRDIALQKREKDIAMPKILLDKHNLLKIRACDGEDELIVTMLLGRKAPQVHADVAKKKELTAFVQRDAFGAETEKSLQLSFSAQQVQKFVTQVNDTNSLHTGDKPLVPGLLLLQSVVEHLPEAQSVKMRFSVPIFADEQVSVRVLYDETAKKNCVGK